MSLNLLMRMSGRSWGRRENHHPTKKASKPTAMATKTMSCSGSISACSVRGRELALVGRSLELLNSAFNPVGEAALDLDRQPRDYLVRAGRGGVSDRWAIIDVLTDRILVPHVRPRERRDDSQVRNIPLS